MNGDQDHMHERRSGPVWPVRSNPGTVAALAAVALAACFALGCERAPSADSLKEWSPADHHSNDDDKLANGAQPANAGNRAARGSGSSDTAQLVDLAWRSQCTRCHGPLGKGDGPMGPMVQAPDLTRDDWQGKVADGEMASIIKTGKNKMPKFDLPDPVIQGLVARIRAVRGQ